MGTELKDGRSYELVKLQNSLSKDFAGREGFSTSFGEAIVGTRQNNVNVPFNWDTGYYGLKHKDNTTIVTTSGTGYVSHENETAYVNTGTGEGLALIESKQINRYITGHMNEAFHTMVADGEEAGVNIGIGYGDKNTDFLGYGKQGLDVGIWLILRGVVTFIKQEDWNQNTLLEGEFILDFDKENISGNSFIWLGVGDISFYINTGIYGWKLVHVHQTLNKSTKPHMENPTRRMSVWAERVSGSGNNIRLGTSSWYAGTIGESPVGTGADRPIWIERTEIPIVGGTETVLFNIRNKTTYKGKDNTIRARYGTVNITSDGTKPVVFRVYINAVDRGVGIWADYDSNSSVLEVNTDSPLVISPIALLPTLSKIEEQIGGTFLNKVDKDRLNLFEGDVIIPAYPDDIITITCISPNSSTLNAILRIIEEH